MLNLLRSPRWMAFTAAAITAIIAFGALSLWQWHRAEEKRAEFARVEQALNAPVTTPAPTDTVTEWQRVAVTGRYTGEQFLIRNRPLDGSNGFWVVTGLTGDDGHTWVVRGWMPASVSASTTVAAPAPPTGEVTVTGYARNPDPDPARPADDLPGGQATAVNTGDLDQLAGRTGGSRWYVVAESSAALTPIATPEATDSRNLSYAGQWLLFAAIAIGGWYYFLRREAAETSESAEADRTPAGVS